MKIKYLIIIIVFFSTTVKVFSQTYTIPWATQQPAWVFPLWFEDGSGQKDTLYIGYDPNSNIRFGGEYYRPYPDNGGAADTIFGEIWLKKPDSAFFAFFSNSYLGDSMSKVNITPGYSFGYTSNNAIWLSNAIWPITIKYDINLFDADTLPISDTLKPKVYGEFWCGDTWPASDFNCLNDYPTFYLSDTVHNYFFWPANSPTYLRRDSIVLTGNNDLTIADNLSMILNIIDIHKMHNGIEKEAAPLPFEIFPNPAQGYFKVRSNLNTTYALRIFDSMGKQVMSKVNLFDEETISLKGLPSGLYLVQVLNKQANQTFKLMKQ
jgi:hypothetical protein